MAWAQEGIQQDKVTSEQKDIGQDSSQALIETQQVQAEVAQHWLVAMKVDMGSIVMHLQKAQEEENGRLAYEAGFRTLWAASQVVVPKKR